MAELPQRKTATPLSQVTLIYQLQYEVDIALWVGMTMLILQDPAFHPSLKAVMEIKPFMPSGRPMRTPLHTILMGAVHLRFLPIQSKHLA